MRCSSCGFELTGTRKFCSECGEPVATASRPEAPPQSRSAPDSATSPVDGERRQLTVLFTDLVGSTAMASRLDPEDWREVVSTYQQECASVIERFGGYVAQYLGDGLVVYFGYPTAGEDDALRAARAGLGILEALTRLEPRLAHHGVKLSARLGVHTGTVVVGEIGSSARRETLALGDTTNLAARLQEVAEPGTLVVSGATFRLIRGHFATEDRGVHSLKGITKPIAVYRVLRAVRVRSTTTSGKDSGVLPLLGRSEELGKLLEAWESAKQGHARTVLLSGEAGIGKSRLVMALRQAMYEQPHTWLDCSGSARTADTPLVPIITLQEDAFGLTTFSKPEQKTAQIERSLGQLGMPAEEHLPLLTALHSLPLPPRFSARELTPEALRKRTMDSLVEWFLRLSDEQPLVVLIEDLHWVDPTSLELLESLRQRMSGKRILLLMTHRPAFDSPWTSAPDVTSIALARLPPGDCVALVSSLKATHGLPDDVVREIVARSDGIPLFVEELTAAVLDAEASGHGGRAAVPSTLQDSLMARLDQLGPAKETAQLCAALGREFPGDVLRAASRLTGAELDVALDRLVSSGLLLKKGDAAYSFRHALIQEQAYESLLKTTRQTVHRKIADVLSTSFPKVVSTQPELLAHHYDAGGMFEPALGFWLQAGQKSVSRSANVEASRQLRRGLDALYKLPRSIERDQQELLLLMMRGVALIASSGYAAKEVEDAFARARALCTELGDIPHLHPVLFGLFLYYMVRADGKSAHELVEQLDTVATHIGDSEYTLEAHTARGAISYWEGNFTECNEQILKARVLYDPAKHGHHPFVYGQDPLAYGYCYGALTLWILGYPEQAQDSARKALDLAERTNHPLTFAGILSFATDLEYHLRDFPTQKKLAERMLAVTTEQALPLWGTWARTMIGSATVDLGDPTTGIAEIIAGMEGFRATGARMNVSYLLARLSAAHLTAGQLEPALERVNEALRLRETDFDCYYDAELFRIKGEIQRRIDGTDLRAAEACFERALEIARSQRARSFELRAAMGLGSLMYDTGRRQEALALLGPVYEWFTEGHETPDLKDARRLLDLWRC